MAITALPGANGSRRTARIQVNACRVSLCQLPLNVPGLLVDRRHVRRAPGVEHEQAGATVAEHLVGEGLVGGVADDRGEGVAELSVHGA